MTERIPPHNLEAEAQAIGACLLNQAVIGDIAELVQKHFPLTPRGIIKHLDLQRPIYQQTARHGHFGRIPGKDGAFSWEKTDMASALAKAAGTKPRSAA